MTSGEAPSVEQSGVDSACGRKFLAGSVPASAVAAGPVESVSFVEAERAASGAVALAAQDGRETAATGFAGVPRAMVWVELVRVAAARDASGAAEVAPRVGSTVPAAWMFGIAAWVFGIAVSKISMRLSAVSHVGAWTASPSSKSDPDEEPGGPPAGTERGAWTLRSARSAETAKLQRRL